MGPWEGWELKSQILSDEKVCTVPRKGKNYPHPLLPALQHCRGFASVPIVLAEGGGSPLFSQKLHDDIYENSMGVTRALLASCGAFAFCQNRRLIDKVGSISKLLISIPQPLPTPALQQQSSQHDLWPTLGTQPLTLIPWLASLPTAGSWNPTIFKAHSNPSHSMTLISPLCCLSCHALGCAQGWLGCSQQSLTRD